MGVIKSGTLRVSVISQQPNQHIFQLYCKLDSFTIYSVYCLEKDHSYWQALIAEKKMKEQTMFSIQTWNDYLERKLYFQLPPQHTN